VISITAGPDGALWFSDGRSIGRITTTGTVTHYTGAGINSPGAITAGSDGALWFANGKSIGRITTAGLVSNYTGPGVNYPGSITAGPDGALWFTLNLGNNAIGRISTAGLLTTYTDPSMREPFGITGGPDGAVWFLNQINSIGRITTADSVVVSPSLGRKGTSVTIRGAGFSPGERVLVTFDTGLSSPRAVPLCSGVAIGTGTFSCTASVPADAGGAGTHTIKARGKTSHTKAKAVFLLTV
jgi:streptogramin lyase